MKLTTYFFELEFEHSAIVATKGVRATNRKESWALLMMSINTHLDLIVTVRFIGEREDEVS